jgi:hypothetical protein
MFVFSVTNNGSIKDITHLLEVLLSLLGLPDNAKFIIFPLKVDTGS